METQQPDPLEQKSRFPTVFLVLAGVVLALMVVAGGVWWYLFASSRPTHEVSLQKVESQKVTIGYTQWPGYVAFLVARDMGYFTDEGVDVELKNYTALSDADKDYQKGTIQGLTNLGLDSIHEAQAGLDHKIVLLIDHSYGSDGIIARPGIKDIKDIKGKKVAYEFGTLEEFFLRYALQDSDLSLSDIQPVNLNPEEAAKSLIKKEIDVAVTYEPFMSNALNAAGGTKIYSSQQAPELISDVLTFRSDFIEKNPNTIASIIRAYFRAIDYIKFNPALAYTILAKAYGISMDDVILQLGGVKIASEEANRAAFSKDTGAQSLYANLQNIAQFVQATDKEAKPFDSGKLIDPTFVNEYLAAKKY